MKYNFKQIERKWQKVWSKNKYKVWAASDSASVATSAKGAKSSASQSMPKAYVLDMFPYPSGEGLHVGHVEGYTASDIYSRFLRMNGRNVLHPMGWDAFGLPAENYAIKTKTHPQKVVERNVKRFKQQLESLGFSYDWQREINTTDPDYYKWTQWIFLQLFKKGLAYEAELPVNWCPSCKTVLANEEVMDGVCERCGSQAERKKLKQWVLKITAYADRLLKDLEGLDWPERVKEMQKNWIGRSEGTLIKFKIKNFDEKIEVFTTRSDTLAGATYLVLAPEHSILKNLKPKIKNWAEVKKYIEQSKNRSERERQENKKKTGVELKGIRAVNPINDEEIPVWLADYVLAHYGTGAIMAVPAHDQRDFEFAAKFELPIKIVICPNYPEKTCPILEKAHEGEGHLVGSGQFDGLTSQEAKKIISEYLAKKDIGKITVNYKLRDWIFSRQRYWGEPIPIIKCEKCALRDPSGQGNIPVPEKNLPVELPKVRRYEPTGKTESPLAVIEKWVKVKCPKCGGLAKRETNTMPQWAGSNWYYLRYLDSKNKKLLISREKEKYWMPVDLYVGGVEHAVLHLLYARFWHKFLYDLGIVSTSEPFKKLVNQGLILGPDGQKMSKSRGNVVNPDDLIKNFGADSLRLYEMFMGPLEDAKPWDPRGIIGVFRFLNRIYVLFSRASKSKAVAKNLKIEKLLHQTIKKVTEDIQNFRFNTAVSALMILVNEMEKQETLNINDLSLLLKLLFPFAPHLSQELWQKLSNPSATAKAGQASSGQVLRQSFPRQSSGQAGQVKLLDYEEWPKWKEELIQEEEFELIIQINGKMRATVTAKKGINEAEAKKLALTLEPVKKWVSGQNIKKTIFVKDRLINLLV